MKPTCQGAASGDARLLFYTSILAVIAVACSVPGDIAQTLPPPDAVSATATPQPTDVESGLPLAILVAGPGSDAALAAEIEAMLAPLAGESGAIFERRETLAVEEFTESLGLVVAIPPDPGLGGWAASFPNTQFVAVGIAGLQAGGNLTVVGGGGAQADQQGFIAGYLAAVVTPDWRAGVISVADTPEGQGARQGFLTGVEYFCGLCNPFYPPFLAYPLYAELPAGTTDWQGAADLLIQNVVDTIYIAPGAGDTNLAAYLANAGKLLIGTGAPPPEAAGQWLASVERGLTVGLEEVLRKALAGEASGQVNPAFALTHVNTERLSAGRRANVEAIMLEVQSGAVAPTRQ